MESPLHKITDGQFQLVYNALSFTMASMMASTLFFWLRLGSIADKFQSALCITGLVTFIAAYHYWRIFNSWDEAFTYTGANYKQDGVIPSPVMTGKPFNDAYRYMDWLLTVPLLLIEIVFVMELKPDETVRKATMLGVASALMIIIGYPGELILDPAKLNGRWGYWAGAMIPFLFVVYTLLVGLRGATAAEPDDDIRSKIYGAQWMTVISWLTYPVVYIIPMMGAQGSAAVVGIQIGYCISDIISKCGVGLLIYSITVNKSKNVN